MYKALGYFIIVMCCLNTVSFWLLAKNDLSILLSQPLLSLSQICGLLGLVLMSLTLLFSTRFAILEDIFGGLDRDYYIHHILGNVSFLLLLNHPLLLIVRTLPNYTFSWVYIFPSTENIAYTYGIFALYSMFIPFLFIVFIKITYNKWLWTHRILVISFLFSAMHVVSATSDVSVNIYLRSWIWIFIIIGGFSAIYMLILYRFLGPRYEYTVSQMYRKGDILQMQLAAVGRRMFYQPGQFIYIKLFSPGVSTEMHPFTLSSAPWEDTLRVSIKALGDFTKQMTNIQQRDKVIVYGPYGRFGHFFRKSNKPVLMIAGGIGVTPFLSMIRFETVYPKPRKIFLVYSYETYAEGVFNEEIKALVQYAPHIIFVPWCTYDYGYFTAQSAVDIAEDIRKCAILLCGPEQMMMSLQEQFVQMGVREEEILFENFNYM
jgi:predicted ferric reductase